MWRRLLATALMAWLALGLSAQAQAPQKRMALVIGNAAYGQSPLRNPVNDARAMAATLRQVGFQVIQRENATKQQMEHAVGEFGRALRPGTVALFYFAGHGMQVNGRNFLVPTDATIANEASVRLETLDVDLVMDQIAASGSDVNLVILDACRNNPFERRFRGMDGGLAQINAPKGTLIAYATAPGKVAADGGVRNGVYTEKLVEAIKTPGLPLEEVFKRVRIEVSRETNDAQTPWEASSLVGNFYFTGPTTVVVNAPPVDREALHWQSVKDTNDADQLQTYLDQYPKGSFAGLARTRIAALRKAPAAPTAATAPAAAAAAPPVVPSTAFDGSWLVALFCPRHTDGAKEYSYSFPAEIKGGKLHGEWRSKESAATLDLDGVIGPDGTALLRATGTTGGAAYSIKRVAEGTEVEYGVQSQFDGNRGTGKRVKLGRSLFRVCDFTFTRQR